MTSYRQTLYENYFSHQAGRYLSNAEQQLQNDTALLRQEILPLIPPNTDAHMLDVGCGYGSLVQVLVQQGYHNVLGIDLSEEQVEKAYSLGIKNVYQTDVFAFFEDNNTFYDCIVALDLIEHFSKTELLELLRQIRQKLSPQGYAIFRTPNTDGLFGSVYAYGDYTHETLLNCNSAIQLMRSAGFGEVNVMPSKIIVRGFLKKILQRVSYALMTTVARSVLFATGRSTRNVIFTPNMLIKVSK